MDKITAQQILKNERLRYYNWFQEHELRPNEVIIFKKGEKWIVCVTDEKACIVDTSYRFYNNEEDELSSFIKLLKLEKILIR